MKSLVLSKFDLTYLSIFACLLFLLVFICAVIWVYRPESRNLYNKLGKLPTEGDHSND